MARGCGVVSAFMLSLKPLNCSMLVQYLCVLRRVVVCRRLDIVYQLVC
jgi:hypothetical protein